MEKETDPNYFLYSFNNKIREEMKKTIPNPYATTNNFHSVNLKPTSQIETKVVLPNIHKKSKVK